MVCLLKGTLVLYCTKISVKNEITKAAMSVRLNIFTLLIIFNLVKNQITAGGFFFCFCDIPAYYSII